MVRLSLPTASAHLLYIFTTIFILSYNFPALTRLANGHYQVNYSSDLSKRELRKDLGGWYPDCALPTSDCEHSRNYTDPTSCLLLDGYGYNSSFNASCLCPSDSTHYFMYIDATSYCHDMYHQPPRGCDSGVELISAELDRSPSLDRVWISPSTSLNAPRCIDFNADADRCSGSRLNSTDTSTPWTFEVIQSIDLSCFCKSVDFARTNATNCRLSWERRDLLTWMNKTCSAEKDWKGLPSQWETLLSVQDSELLPWNWEVRSSDSSSVKPHCPSSSAKLGAFAAANVAMTLLVPIIGRRDVIKKLSFGFCGNRGSTMWLLTGPITVSLHIFSNVLAASLINKTPGYGATNIGQLVLIWNTRPRSAWMIVALLPMQAKQAIYISVVTSTLLGEVLLPLIGAYYMGFATDYARRQQFYSPGRLKEGGSHGPDGLLMYSGSAMCGYFETFSIIIHRLGSKSRNWLSQLDLEKQHSEREEVELDRYLECRSGFQAIQALGRHILQEQSNTIIALTKEMDRWGRFQKYFKKGRDQVYTTQKDLRQQEKNLGVAQKTNSVQTEAQQAVTDRVSQKYERVFQEWRETPENEIMAISPREKTNEREMAHSSSYGMKKLMFHIHHRFCGLSTKEGGWDRSTVDRQLIPDSRGRPIQETSLMPPEHLRRLRNTVVEMKHWESHAKKGQYWGDVYDPRPYLLSLHTLDQPYSSWIEFYQAIMEILQVDQHNSPRIAVQQMNTYLDDILHQIEGTLTTWRLIEQSRAELLKLWQYQDKKRKKEERDEEDGAFLKKIAWRTIFGMLGCWIAQWMWWAGYIRVAGDSYCPPKLPQITFIWVVFSAFGAFLGGGL